MECSKCFVGTNKTLTTKIFVSLRVASNSLAPTPTPTPRPNAFTRILQYHA
ncbi:unnamed protein product [Chondrus crispus]|uniref:Uncharacterized protein n=1 Tax=Chondrus crispus TaxID=2769 RepID=R7Q8N8_CHOCR|nr:unnamed protein product [Chondrus crispus]CDF33756.1 unnamed protein product [Chondrus crispus]|eukprot:XP_005713575.1 unnamed protein product [Chondrus crispus]